jgi:hypothetical protein
VPDADLFAAQHRRGPYRWKGNGHHTLTENTVVGVS